MIQHRTISTHGVSAFVASVAIRIVLPKSLSLGRKAMRLLFIFEFKIVAHHLLYSHRLPELFSRIVSTVNPFPQSHFRIVSILSFFTNNIPTPTRPQIPSSTRKMQNDDTVRLRRLVFLGSNDLRIPIKDTVRFGTNTGNPN